MALSTYNDLLTAIQNYEDDSSSVVTGVLADMVTLAEQRIFSGSGSPGDPYYTPALRVKAMERTVVIPIGPGLEGGSSTGSGNAHELTLATAPTLALGLTITFTASYTNTGATTLNANGTGVATIKRGLERNDLTAGDIVSGGVYTVYYDGTYYVLMPSDGAAPLPANCLGIKNAYLQNRGVILTYQDNLHVNIEMDGATASMPEFYTIEGDCLRFSPLPDSNYKLVLTYHERPLALSSALNDVFRRAPGIYLFGTLFELALYLPNDAAAAKYFSQFRAALDGYANSMARGGATYGNTRIRIGGVVA